jgi:hypothetical protein
MEEHALSVAERRSAINTRTDASNASIHRPLQEQNLFPSYIRPMQHFVACIAPERHAFTHRILQQYDKERIFTPEILFTDESCFTTDASTGIHKELVWSVERLRVVEPYLRNYDLPCKLWAGILTASTAAKFYRHSPEDAI